MSLAATAKAAIGAIKAFASVAVAAITTRLERGAAENAPRMTVIGRMADLKRFENEPTVDTWWKSGRIPKPGEKPVSWSENADWLRKRAARGDTFGIATDPSSLPNVLGGYVPGSPNGYFTAKELQLLRSLGVEPERL
jgi:hypothetical protein